MLGKRKKSLEKGKKKKVISGQWSVATIQTFDYLFRTLSSEAYRGEPFNIQPFSNLIIQPFILFNPYERVFL